MSLLPVTSWTEVATKHDLSVLRETFSTWMDHFEVRLDRIETRMDRFDDKLDNLSSEIRAQGRLFTTGLVSSVIGSVLAVAAIAFAANLFG